MTGDRAISNLRLPAAKKGSAGAKTTIVTSDGLIEMDGCRTSHQTAIWASLVCELGQEMINILTGEICFSFSSSTVVMATLSLLHFVTSRTTADAARHRGTKAQSVGTEVTQAPDEMAVLKVDEEDRGTVEALGGVGRVCNIHIFSFHLPSMPAENLHIIPLPSS